MLFFFFFNDTATTEIYTLSLHDALPIYAPDVAVELDVVQAVLRRLDVERVLLAGVPERRDLRVTVERVVVEAELRVERQDRSEEHTSELQSRPHLVCRLLLEKKKKYQWS